MRIVVGEGSCGIATGAKKTAIEFEKQIKDRKIKNVTVSLTGCVGTCFLEPIVDVYDDDGKMTRYTKVLTAKVNDIIESHIPVSYTHLRAHETRHDLVCRLLLEKKKKKINKEIQKL